MKLEDFAGRTVKAIELRGGDELIVRFTEEPDLVVEADEDQELILRCEVTRMKPVAERKFLGDFNPNPPCRGGGS